MNKQHGLAAAYIIIILVLLVGAITFGLMQLGDDDSADEPVTPVSQNQDAANTPSDTSTPVSDERDEAEPKTLTVTFTDNFNPSPVTINIGDSVKFVNDSQRDIQPSSNNHPTHDVYPGFESPNDIPPGGSWSFTFTQLGTWGYHDHNLPDNTGTVVVQ